MMDAATEQITSQAVSDDQMDESEYQTAQLQPEPPINISITPLIKNIIEFEKSSDQESAAVKPS